jgi:hypothetical protein
LLASLLPFLLLLAVRTASNGIRYCTQTEEHTFGPAMLLLLWSVLKLIDQGG